MDTNLLRLKFAVKQLSESTQKSERISIFNRIIELVETMKWDTAYNVIPEDFKNDNRIFSTELYDKQ